jgi:predicted RNase H-like HicB family nuclease
MTRRPGMIQHTIKAVGRRGEQSGYVAECVEIPVVTQGGTLDEVAKNLQEAVALHLAGVDLAALGLAPNPTVVITMELSPTHA